MKTSLHGLDGIKGWLAAKQPESLSKRGVTVDDLLKKGSKAVWIVRVGKRVLKWLGFRGIGAGMDGAATGAAPRLHRLSKS